jgi:hypothetical protein
MPLEKTILAINYRTLFKKATEGFVDYIGEKDGWEELVMTELKLKNGKYCDMVGNELGSTPKIVGQSEITSSDICDKVYQDIPEGANAFMLQKMSGNGYEKFSVTYFDLSDERHI